MDEIHDCHLIDKTRITSFVAGETRDSPLDRIPFYDYTEIGSTETFLFRYSVDGSACVKIHIISIY